MGKSSSKWKKATNAVGRKLCAAMYHIMMSGQDFSYENYTIMKNAAIFDISVDELPMLNLLPFCFNTILQNYYAFSLISAVSPYNICTQMV